LGKLLSWNRFRRFAVKIREKSQNIYWSAIFFAHAPGYYLTFASFALFDLSNRRSSEKSIFTSCSVLIDSATICICFLISFFLSSSDHGIFWESFYSSLCVNMCCTWVETKPKRWIYYRAYTDVANRIVWSFVWRKFSSVGKGEWWDEMKNGQKLKLGDAHVTLRNIQEVQASKLGDAPRHPFSSAKIRSPFKTIYFYCFVFYAFFLERLYFRF
jgi:hypothetical protein